MLLAGFTDGNLRLMNVRIYKPVKTAMQQGRAKTGQWILEYEQDSARRPEPLMGWSASADTKNQVHLRFSSQEEALSFAQEKGWTVDLQPPSQKRIKPRNYSDNFKYIPPDDA